MLTSSNLFFIASRYDFIELVLYSLYGIDKVPAVRFLNQVKGVVTSVENDLLPKLPPASHDNSISLLKQFPENL